MTLIVQSTDITATADAFDEGSGTGIDVNSSDELVVTADAFIAAGGSIIDINNLASFDFTFLGDAYTLSDGIRMDTNSTTATTFEFYYRIAIGADATITARDSVGFFGVTATGAGIRDARSLVEFNNAGTLVSTTRDGLAFQTVGTVHFANSGQITSFDFETISITNVGTATLINTGSITSLNSGLFPNDAAISVDTTTEDFTFINTGDLTSPGVAITSAVTNSEMISNVGSIIGDVQGSGSVGGLLENSGVIQGDVLTFGGDDTVTNTNEILGGLFVGTFDDVVENSGLISGDVELSLGDDVYLAIGSGTVGGVIDGGSGEDTITGGTQADVIDGDNNDDLIRGRAGDDTLDGGLGNDTLRAGSGDDEIEGGGGNDFIRAGAGEDIINGSEGSDTIFGGTDADVFVFEATADSPDDNALRDVIQDFVSGQDVIDLSAFGGLSFVGNAGFSGTGAEIYVTDANAIGRVKVFVDTNGDGTADMKIVLNNTTTLTEDDFLF